MQVNSQKTTESAGPISPFLPLPLPSDVPKRRDLSHPVGGSTIARGRVFPGLSLKLGNHRNINHTILVGGFKMCLSYFF